MSDILRAHINDFGFSHSEISRRATKLNQTTTYRVVEGETQNPSLNSLTGIIEAIALTDADAGVLYRKMGMDNAKPRLYVLPDSDLTFECAKREAQDFLDTGHVREAAYRVMMMFDLASDDIQLSTTYEHAGIVYMGMGRWEEAQANFEAADRHIPEDIDHPNTTQEIINRKHTLMTNIGSLMVKRGNYSWAILFATAILNHSRTTSLNRGWAYLVLGNARLGMHNPTQAEQEFQSALELFESDLQNALQTSHSNEDVKQRWVTQAQGNIRWTRIHLLKSQLESGNLEVLTELKKCTEDWKSLDPECSTLAGVLWAKHIPQNRRRTQTLRSLYETAKRYNLGDLMNQITALMVILCMILGPSTFSSTQLASVETTPSFMPDTNDHPRGNTGRK